MTVPTTSQVKKAGSIIRKFSRGDLEDLQAFNSALELMEAWRRAHYSPLVTANNGLRSMARTVSVPAEITQRLKRRQTIIEKLSREPTLDLSRMQDIAGCRAVVKDMGDLRRLEAQLKRRRNPVGYADYTEKPRSSGYRGVHVIVEYQSRHVEVQLRTTWMHEWALASEYFSGLLGENLKQDGTHPVQLFLATASEIMNLRALGQPVPVALERTHQERRLEAARTIPNR